MFRNVIARSVRVCNCIAPVVNCAVPVIISVDISRAFRKLQEASGGFPLLRDFPEWSVYQGSFGLECLGDFR